MSRYVDFTQDSRTNTVDQYWFMIHNPTTQTSILFFWNTTKNLFTSTIFARLSLATEIPVSFDSNAEVGPYAARSLSVHLAGRSKTISVVIRQ